MGGMSTEPFKLDFVALLVDGIQRDVTIIGEHYEVTYSSDATEREFARQLHAAGAPDAPLEEQIRAMLSAYAAMQRAGNEMTQDASLEHACHAAQGDRAEAVEVIVLPIIARLTQERDEAVRIVDSLSRLLAHERLLAEDATTALRQRAERAETALANAEHDRANLQAELANVARLGAEHLARAERAERERDESRITKQKVDEHVNAAAEVVRLRARIAELEAPRGPGLWLTTWTSDDGTIRAWSHDTESGARETFAAFCNPHKMLARVVDPAPRPASREPGADVVEALAMTGWAAQERERDEGDAFAWHELREEVREAERAGIRAVISALAAMGEDAWPPDWAVVRRVEEVTLASPEECQEIWNAVDPLYRSRLSPVLGAQKATIADLQASIVSAANGSSLLRDENEQQRMTIAEQAKRITDLEEASRLVVAHHEASKSRESHPLERGDAMRDRGLAIEAMGALLRKEAP